MSGDDDIEQDGETGQKCHKKSQPGPRKAMYRRGYSQGRCSASVMSLGNLSPVSSPFSYPLMTSCGLVQGIQIRRSSM